MGVARSIAIGSKQVVVGRTDLIGGGLIAASLALGLAHISIRSDPVPEIVTTAEPVELARLPRARPQEPFTTGSIDPNPGQRRSRPSAEPAQADQSAKQVFATVDDLEGKAFLIASSSPACDQVVGTDVLRNGSAAEIAVSIRCENGAHFFLDRDAILDNRIGSPETSVGVLSGEEAIRACEDKLRTGLAVPPSLDRLPSSTGVEAISGDDAVVSFDFAARSGLGFPLFMHVRCEIRAREIARLDVQAR